MRRTKGPFSFPGLPFSPCPPPSRSLLLLCFVPILHRGLVRSFPGLLWALPRLGLEVPAALGESLRAATVRNAEQLNATGVANSLWGLSRHSTPPSAACSCSPPIARSLTCPRSLLPPRLQLDLTDEDCAPLLRRAEQLLPSMDPPTASCTIQAAARLTKGRRATVELAALAEVARNLVPPLPPIEEPGRKQKT